MAELRDVGNVPTWDGAARSWRRYTREVAWFVQSTPVYKRRYCASKLMGKLTGPARLLAMSWPQMTFDAEDGTKKLLQRLAGSPLVRKSLPNAAAICQQYFAFRRGHQESMGNFLVRETLVHEEFVEALIRLHEEQLGISQDSRDFGLPAVETDDTWENPWWGSMEDYEDEDAALPRDAAAPPGDSPDEDGQTPPGPEVPDRRGATGSSLSHRGNEAPAATPSAAPEIKTAIDEMSVADSFIMGVLRGWRLLQAAGLSAEEKRDILSTTRNSLNYEVISQALQGLWDEQLLGHRQQHGGHMNYMDSMDVFYTGSHDYEEDWDDGWSSWWDDHTNYYQAAEDDWWDESWDGMEAQTTATAEDKEEDNPQLREAQQAEQLAESLAMEAQRTWAEAKSATQALRKDRGFGAVKGGGGRCFICGGPHFARECPRRGSSPMKGKGKGAYGAIYEDYYTSKSKGKGKSKGKPKGFHRNMMMEAQAQWMKGKNKGKGSNPARTVNIYAADANYLGGLEIRDSLDLASASTSSIPDSQAHVGMLDSGATASAAPEIVIKGLISSILTQDKDASVNFDTSARPYFRFGNGRWGRALSRVSLTSRASGTPVTFSLYMLPNPPNAVIDSSAIPPLLVGMDFIQDVGLLVDFRSGLAMNTCDPEPSIYELPRNRKGHLMVDVRYHLTKGKICDQGHAHITVCQNLADVCDHDNQWLELSVVWFDMSECDAQFDHEERMEIESRMWMLHQQARERSSPTASASAAQMCKAATAENPSTTSSSRSLLDGGVHPSAADGGIREDRGGEHQGQVQGEDQGTTPGPFQASSRRHTRSSGFCSDVAVLQPTHGRQPEEQCARRVGALCGMRPTARLHSTRRVAWTDDKCKEPGDGEEDAGRAQAVDGRLPTYGSHMPGNAIEDRRGGDLEDGNPGTQGVDNIIVKDSSDDNKAGNLKPRDLQRQLAADQRHGAAPCLRTKPGPSVKKQDQDFKALPVPQHVGKKVMMFASLMTAATTSLLTGLHLDGHDGLWEVSCTAHNMLSKLCEDEGLQPRRFDLKNGYDFYRPEAWHQLRQLRQVRRPLRIWLSLPCSSWCPWHRLDKNQGNGSAQQDRALRRNLKLLQLAVDFIKETVTEMPETEIYWEWTHPNNGWKQLPMRELACFFDQRGVPWLRCRVDGCVYGLRDANDDGFIQKKWMIMTTDERFHQDYHAKVCHGGHRHSYMDNLETNNQIHYPEKMCKSIVRHWQSRLVPQRHLRLLRRRDDLPSLMDKEVIETNECDYGIDYTSLGTTIDSQINDVLEVIETSECDDGIDYLSGDPLFDDYVSSTSGVHNLNVSSTSGVHRLSTENMAQAARRSQDFSVEMCEKVLLSLRCDPGKKGYHHGRGTQPGVNCILLGGYSFGKFHGVCKRTVAYPETTQYLNGFMARQAPGQTWSSLQVSYDTSALPHRDVHNLKLSNNIVYGLGDYKGGALWVCGEPSGQQQPVRRLLPDGSKPKGYLLPTFQQVAIFSPSSWHATQKWTGRRIIISAYTTRMLPHFTRSDSKILRNLRFPLPDLGKYALTAMVAEVREPAEPPLLPAPAVVQTQQPEDLPDGVSQHEMEQWRAKVAKLHRSAGHPTNRNLARIIEEAGHPLWKVKVAKEFQCPTCQSLKPGGTSSGQVPPASLHRQYKAWEAVAIDAGEWIPPNSKKKINFLLFMDVATKLRVIQPLETYDFLQRRSESADDLMKSLSERWLGIFPKPRVLLFDSARSFASEKIQDFASDLNILIHYIAEKESWAHGTIEAAVQDVKLTASAIHLESRDQPLDVTLQLAVSALNSTEYTAGFSAFQWAYGRNFNISDEDHVTFQQVDPRTDFVQLVTARQKAEDIARSTRAKRALTKLSNTTVRQPLRSYNPMDLVKVWRRVWPQTQHKGPRGGFRMSPRPHWVGPGRVVFSEVLPHQEHGDDRRHIIWVLVGRQLLRCSTHSVRPVTETERFEFETSGSEDPGTWQSLSDLIPKREYYDLVDQAPDEEEVELPQLPDQPDSTTTVVPRRRLVRKTTFRPGEYTADPVQDRLQHEDVNEYETGDLSAPSSSTTRPIPELGAGEEPGTKRPKVASQKRTKIAEEFEYDLHWVEELEDGAAAEEGCGNIFEVMEDVNEFLRVEIDLEPITSNRQKKMLMRNPVAYMVKKMRDSEVVISRLPAHERALFERAKAKEVDSFLKNEAVRKCLSSEEIKQAYDSQRIVRARWVLTWKLVPTDEQQQALNDAKENPNTMHDRQGRRKAKARIVLLGFQHPSLLDPTFKTASPVQSVLGRNLLYLLAAQRQWSLEGLDLATAFLQTNPTAADECLWTTGVQELRDALGVEEEGIMRILRNIYGSTTAPRGLWLDLHKTLTRLGAIAILGERCLWVWFSKTERDHLGYKKLLGAMGGHVDDFHRVGDNASPEWLEIKKAVDSAYKWGMAKSGSYRHAGTDVTTEKANDGTQKIVVDQSYYIEGLQDVDITPERLQGGDDVRMNTKDVAACRAALGALQWLAVQSQPQLCSRCNLLLTETVTSGTLSVAKEIQMMINEVRRESFKLQFFKLKHVKHWSEVVFISMGDQAHNNRPKGDSTGGMVTMAAGPESLQGVVCPMALLAWRTWKLKRKAIGSNDAEVQSILEAEDQNFRVRMLWTELNGGYADKPLRVDLVDTIEKQITQVRGVLCTDSRGGYDAVEVNESPLLGLSNMRSALQAFQLRDNLKRTNSELRWVNSEYDLADGLTKKRPDSRIGLLKFLQTWHWSIAFDPSFTSAKKSKKAGRTAVGRVEQFVRQHGESSDMAEPFLGLMQQVWDFVLSANQMQSLRPLSPEDRGPFSCEPLD